jgi:hypothetical protein
MIDTKIKLITFQNVNKIIYYGFFYSILYLDIVIGLNLYQINFYVIFI